jgi:hypothetical protein
MVGSVRTESSVEVHGASEDGAANARLEYLIPASGQYWCERPDASWLCSRCF